MLSASAPPRMVSACSVGGVAKSVWTAKRRIWMLASESVPSGAFSRVSVTVQLVPVCAME